MSAAKRSPPVGAAWRILAHGRGRNGRVDIRSADYPAPRFGHAAAMKALGIEPTTLAKRTVLDEVVISGGVLHLEQLDTRTWWLCIGEDMLTFTVRRDGTVKRGEWYR